MYSKKSIYILLILVILAISTYFKFYIAIPLILAGVALYLYFESKKPREHFTWNDYFDNVLYNRTKGYNVSYLNNLLSMNVKNIALSELVMGTHDGTSFTRSYFKFYKDGKDYEGDWIIVDSKNEDYDTFIPIRYLELDFLNAPEQYRLLENTGYASKTSNREALELISFFLKQEAKPAVIMDDSHIHFVYIDAMGRKRSSILKDSVNRIRGVIKLLDVLK